MYAYPARQTALGGVSDWLADFVMAGTDKGWTGGWNDVQWRPPSLPAPNSFRPPAAPITRDKLTLPIAEGGWSVADIPEAGAQRRDEVINGPDRDLLARWTDTANSGDPSSPSPNWGWYAVGAAGLLATILILKR